MKKERKLMLHRETLALLALSSAVGGDDTRGSMLDTNERLCGESIGCTSGHPSCAGTCTQWPNCVQ